MSSIETDQTNDQPLEKPLKQAFTNASPVEFTLINPEGGPWEDHPNDTIFIVDVLGKTKIDQTLVIKNRSQHPITLGMLGDEESYHFRLAFRHGTFQSPSPIEFETNSAWLITDPKNNGDGSWSVDFICQHSKSFDPGSEFVFPFSYRTADAALGKRGTRMKLFSQGVYFGGQTESFNATTEKQVDVLNLSSNNAYISEIASKITQYDTKTDDIEAAMLSSLYATKDDNEDNLDFATDLSQDMAKTTEQADGSADSQTHGKLSGELNTDDSVTKTVAVNNVIRDTSRKDKMLRNKLEQRDEYGERKFANMKKLISLLVQHGIELDNEVDLKSLAYNAKFETLEALYPLALSCETPTGMVVNQSSSLSVFLYNRSDQKLSFSSSGSIKLICPIGNLGSDMAVSNANAGIVVASERGELEKENSSTDSSVFTWRPNSDLILAKGEFIEISVQKIIPSKDQEMHESFKNGHCFIDVVVSGLIGQQDNTISLPITKVSKDIARLAGNDEIGVGTDSPNFNLDVVGDINTRSKVKEKGFDLIPRGFIAMFHYDKKYSSNKIPDGWGLCDGSNETPNLTKKFIRGASNLSSSVRTGGASSVRLSMSQMPSHNHSASDGGHGHGVNDPGHSHTYNKSTDGRSDNANDRDVHRSHSSKNTSKDKTDISIKEGKADISIGYSGGNSSFSIIPPYYELCYIMKL